MQLVVEELDKIMTDNTEMVVVCLDAMSSLTLTPELKASVSERVLKILDSSSVDHLPVVIRFILQNSSKASIDNVLSFGIRR